MLMANPRLKESCVQNTHAKMLLLIIVLFISYIWTILTRPTRLGLDIQGSIHVVLRAKEELKSQKLEQGQLDTVTNILRNRIDALGVAEPVVYPKPPDQIVVELPGVLNKEQGLAVLQTTARLEFRSVPALDNGTWHTEAEVDTYGKPTGYEVLLGLDGKPVPESVLAETVFGTARCCQATTCCPTRG
jgi:preprotein translocase subunit SecD